MKAFIVLLLAFVSVSVATDSWSVLKDHIMTLAMGLDFIDSQTGDVAGFANMKGPEILRTTDGGHTWNDTLHEEALLMYMCMAFTDDMHGVAAGMGFDIEEASSSYTSDGGVSWKWTDDRNLIATYQDCEPVKSTPGMIVMPGFWEDILHGGSGEGVAISMNNGVDYAHYDWKINTEPRYASFANAQVGWISGGTWPEDTFSSDPKLHRISRNLAFRDRADGTKESVILPRQPEIAGYEAVIGKTSDGGKTWTMQWNDTGRMYFNGIYCTSPLLCWVVSEGDAGA